MPFREGRVARVPRLRPGSPVETDGFGFRGGLGRLSEL
jgi:hypothetical protein